MSEGAIVALIMGGLLIALVIRWVFFSENERAVERLAIECLGRQAPKRNGTMSGRVLTVPYKGTGIQVAHSASEDISMSYSYATFRAEDFEDKKLGIFYWKETFLRPMLVGVRLEVSADEKFDETYVVSGNDLAFANSFLTREVRDKLLEFESSNLRVILGKPVGSSILSGESGWLSVSAWANYGVADTDYDSVIETAFLFYDRLAALKGAR
jgi:hypothetical protein